MKVSTIERPPFVFYENWEFTWFSIDLLKSIQLRSKINYDLIVEDSFHEMIEKVSNKEIDFAIANISITSEREKIMDFSHPIFDSWIHVLANKKPTWFFESWSFKMIIVVLLWVLLLNIFIKKISTSHWTLMNIPASFYLTVLWILWWWRAVISFVNSVTPEAQAHTNWSPKQYLKQQRVGVWQWTTFSKYLDENYIDYSSYKDYSASLEALKRWEIDVILAWAAVAKYYVTHEWKDEIEIVWEMFAEDKLWIAIKEGKNTRRKINKALLSIIEDWTYEKLMIKYFWEE